MKYSISQYASAFLAAFEGKSALRQREIVRRFAGILRKNKDSTKLGRVVKEVEKQYLRSRGLKKVEVRSVSPFPEGLKKEIKAIFGKKLFWEEKISPDLLGGVKILVDDETLIDASAKRRLNLLLHKN